MTRPQSLNRSQLTSKSQKSFRPLNLLKGYDLGLIPFKMEDNQEKTAENVMNNFYPAYKDDYVNYSFDETAQELKKS